MELPYRYVANLANELPDIPPDSIVSRSVSNEQGVTATLFGFATGQELSEHTSSYPAILHFLQGEAELMLRGERRLAQAGTWVFMPPHTPHSVLAKTTVVMLLLLFRGQS